MTDHSNQNGFASSSSDEEGSSAGQTQEEKTLTDHLNKRLLEAFRNRLDEGTVSVPSTNRSSSDNSEEDEADFDDS